MGCGVNVLSCALTGLEGFAEFLVAYRHQIKQQNILSKKTLDQACIYANPCFAKLQRHQIDVFIRGSNGFVQQRMNLAFCLPILQLPSVPFGGSRLILTMKFRDNTTIGQGTAGDHISSSTEGSRVGTEQT